jgi:hypothetical protein
MTGQPESRKEKADHLTENVICFSQKLKQMTLNISQTFGLSDFPDFRSFRLPYSFWKSV